MPDEKRRTYTRRCPAKLNLTLAVGPPSADPADGGKHPVVSWMAATDFADTLALTPLEQGPSRWSIAFADDAPVKQSVDWPLEDDLAFRAHAAVEQLVGRALPVIVTLSKRVPAGAGLGGGSTDAAGVLSALREHLGHELNADAVLRLARSLGSDVAFALLALDGHPAAIATGFGDVLEPVKPINPLHAALVLPDFACATSGVYAAFDRRRPNTSAPHVNAGPDRHTRDTAQRLAECTTDLTAAGLFNDLTAAACDAQPKLAALLDRLRAADLRPHLTGSGSAVFLPARDADHAAALARSAREATGGVSLPVRVGSRFAEQSNQSD